MKMVRREIGGMVTRLRRFIYKTIALNENN
jgi:hypothetical protein